MNQLTEKCFTKEMMENSTPLEFQKRLKCYLLYDSLPLKQRIKLRIRYLGWKNIPIDVLQEINNREKI